MAEIIPSDLTRLALAGGHTPELATLALLRDTLPRDYVVFHGVHWTREYAAWTHFGEIDFVIVNRIGDVLFIEQKNGTVDEDAGGLTKHYGDGSRDVVRQIHRSLDKVREKFQWRHGKGRRLTVDYLVYLPDHRLRKLNAAGLDRDRVVDASEAGELAARIMALLPPGEPSRDGWQRKVREFFEQTFEVVPSIHAHVAAQERGFARQAGGIASLLANLEMTPFRLRVQGAAGSGKSLVGAVYAEARAALGERVLMLCFNRPLAERLRVSLGEVARVDTWYGFCRAFLDARGQTVDFSSGMTGPEFWRGVQDRVMAEAIPEEWRFDALVVDEGQDFEEEWLDILRLFLRDDAAVLWLEDAEQNLQGKAPVALPGFVTYRCRRNYRSPDSIAHFILRTLPVDFEPANPLPGLGVGVETYDDAAEQPAVVARLLKRLIGMGFAHSDIAILTCRGVQNSVFSTLDAVGGVRLRRFTGEYAGEAQVMTEGEVPFDSVNRYKGQEIPAVILVDVDPRAERLAQELRVLFCGMTRATVRLDLVVKGANPHNAQLLDQR
jgi:hypothetical protein